MKTAWITTCSSLIILTVGFLLGLQWPPELDSVDPPPTTLREFVTLPDAVKQATGHDVIPYDIANPVDHELTTAIGEAITQVCKELNADDSPLKGLSRINEASSYFESRLLERLEDHPAFSCRIPLSSTGKPQRSGYPDLHAIHTSTGRHYYLDPKLYERTAEESSLRTFYYSPQSKRSKIQHSAVHLLLGISHDGNDGDWQFQSWKLLDLSKLSLQLKSEYNASNKELYQDSLIIIQK